MKKIFVLLSLLIVFVSLVLTSCDDGDIVPPVITLPNDSITIVLNAPFTNPKATASDNLDGNLTASINVKSTVNKDSVGVYKLVYYVSDAANNLTEEPMIVTVVNSAASLEGVYTVSETFNGTTDMPYSQNIKVSKSVNNKIIFQKFHNYSSGFVYGMVSGSSLSIPEQDVNCEGAVRKFIGSGSVGSTISVSYTEEVSGIQLAGSASMVKQ